MCTGPYLACILPGLGPQWPALAHTKQHHNHENDKKESGCINESC